jgi:Concanavalin A-like lectin/glucanases superfamily
MTNPLDRSLFVARVRKQMRWTFVAVALGSSGLLGCTDDRNSGEPSQDELTAILKDGELTALSRRALMPAPAPGGASDGGAMGPGRDGAVGSLGGAGGATPVDGGAPNPDGGAGGAGGDGLGGRMGGGFGGQVIGDGGFGGGVQSSQGSWMFDDCNPGRTDLFDSSNLNHTAFRSVSVACVTGVIQQGVGIDEDDDLVYVPDQPDFTFENGVTVAAWVNPKKLGGVRTIFRKRESGTSTFVLLSNGRDYQFVIRLATGRAASVSAKATLGTFTHVAGTYDGHDLRLYLNGALAAHTRVKGVLSNGAGPLLMGNDALDRRMDGALDSVFFSTVASSDAEIARLVCIPHPSTLVATPMSSPPVAAGTPVTYDLAVTNNSCDPQSYQFQASPPTSDLTADPNFSFFSVAVGETQHFPVTVSSSPTIAPDDYAIQMSVFAFFNGFDFASTTVTYSVLGTPCSVRPRKELEIRDVSVVEDPLRTGPGGAWSFGHLMENMAPTPADAPAMVEELLSTWLTAQPVGGFTVAARPAMQDLILAPFPRTAGGALDLSRAPFRLLAIANRIDLQDLSSGSAGEGRFVFGILDQFGNPLQMTLILEYNIPASSAQEVTNLADAWHGLSSLTVPSEAYNAALQAVTDRFTSRNAAPSRINGSALGQLRTNDFFALGEWEFREFHLSATSGHLRPATVALTPDASLNGTTTLADYINTNEAAILQVKHVVPETFEGVPFQGGSMITDFFTWNAPGINNPEARAKFAQNTCNGCHTSSLETNTFVFQVNPRSLGQEAQLSPFLLGTQVFDPFANLFRNFNELGRRARVLHDLVCPDEQLPPPPPDTTPGSMGGPDGGGFGGSVGTIDAGRPGIGGASGGGPSDAGVATDVVGGGGGSTGSGGGLPGV